MKYHYITILFVNLVLIMVCNNSFSQATDDFTSNLPIIFINTDGNSIPDEPKITCMMQIIYNGEGEINSTNDTLMHYDGWIGIERRGSSTQQFEKKSYSLETRDEAGTKSFPFGNEFCILYSL